VIDREVRQRMQADLLAGMGIREVARKYSVSASTVSGLRAAAVALTVIDPEIRADLGEQVAGVLDANLRALRAIALVAGDRAYASRQDADKLGILYGIIADKSIRILNSVRPVSDDGDG
jgi:hypothetical protein